MNHVSVSPTNGKLDTLFSDLFHLLQGWRNNSRRALLTALSPNDPHKKRNLHRHCFRLLLGHFHVPGEIANNGYAKVLGGNRGVLWDCASSESWTQVTTRRNSESPVTF